MNCFATRALKSRLALAWPLFVFAAPSLAGPGIVFSEDFEDGVYDGLVVEVGSAEIGPGLNGSQFGLLSPAAGGDGTRIRIDLLRVTDFSVEADFRIESTVNGDFNIFLNSSENNFVDGYRGNVNPVNGDNTDALLRIEGSNGQVVDGRPQTVQLGETHRLRMERVGSSVTVFLDGVEYLAYTDSNPLSGASMGLIAGIGRTTLDNVVVRDLGSSGVPDCNGNGIPDHQDVTRPIARTFADRRDVSVHDAPTSLALVDLDGDGYRDMIVGEDYGGQVGVYYGRADGSFGRTELYTISDGGGTSTSGFAVEDFDGDGHLDFAVAEHRYGNVVRILYGRAQGGFLVGEPIEVGSGQPNPVLFAYADFDGDSVGDLAVTLVHENAIRILKGASGRTFTPTGPPVPVGAFPYAIATADFNGDRRPDLVTANFMGNTVSVLYGQAGGTFSMHRDYQVGRGPQQLVVAYLDGDEWLDVAVSNQYDNDVTVLYGHEEGVFDDVGGRQDFPVGNGPVGLVRGDWNGDGRPDLATANYLSNTITVLLGDNHGQFGGRQDFPVGSYPLVLATERLDPDGWQDLAVTCHDSDTVSILFSRRIPGSGSYDCNENGIPDECEPDCDDDGWPDVCELPPFGDSADCNDNGVPDECDLFPEWVPVADAGNVGDDTGYGAVDHEYLIGRFEITNAQYCAFLNAVAADDPYHLYSTEMGGPIGGIDRAVVGEKYVYSVKSPGWNDKPVNFVGWYDAARFANWLHNGQPRGPQNSSSTEAGAYTFAGETVVSTRQPGWKFAIPTESEWYKAAFYKGGGLNAGYWNYATGSESAPISEPPPGSASPPGSCNYRDGDLAVGAPYYVTDVGAYMDSGSPYSTFDQNGNVYEWNESPPCLLPSGPPGRRVRGGSWGDGNGAAALHASYWACGHARPGDHPQGDSAALDIGFRLVAQQQPGDCNANGVPDACDGHVCDDMNPCTDDACSGTSCHFTPNSNPCDDGSACTIGDVCVDGSCRAGALRDCDDGVACTWDACDSNTGECVSTPDDAFCDDRLFCTGTESCNRLLGCQAGKSPDCDDGVDCTIDQCDVGLDACVSTPDDAYCDDGLFCTGAESCDRLLGCQPETPPDCRDDDYCTSDWCDEETDACVHLGADSDGDGICDIEDACPDSDPTPTIVIDDCDSGVGNHLFDNGCTMQDQLAECEVSALNHGQYVRCVAKMTNRWKSQGLITGAQKGLIQSCAAQADIPRLAPRVGK